MAGQILISRDADQTLATLTISNPGKLNAIDHAMWLAMRSQLAALAADPALRCLLVRGEGDAAFAAGGDIEEFLHKRMSIEAGLAYREEAVAPALNALAEFPVPVVAMIRGACIGGGLEIAACCDIRLAADDASFGAPINKLGFSMYAGELTQVLAAVGPAVASEILLEGRILDAGEAFTKGLLNRVVPASTLADEVAACCRRIAQGAPLVARAHKQWIRRLRHGVPPTLEEKRASLALIDSDDYREGLNAFLNKRRPQFRGR
jgi:enoyl-CoA hydratase